MLKRIAVAMLLACSPGAPALAQSAAPHAWSLRLAQQQAIDFRGVVNFDKAGKGVASTTYMMPGVAGFAAALAAHSLVINNRLEKQKSEIELEADQVLLPYRAVLDAWPQDALMEQALLRSTTGRIRKTIAFLDRDEAGWIVESTPLFAMTQDQSALVLDNAIAVYAPGALQQAGYRNTVRVVSRATTQADLPAYWNEAEGLQLKQQSAALLALSLDIALAQALLGPASAPGPVGHAAARTVRYQQGQKEVVERAQVLDEHCGRALLRNLRGGLMSVPLAQSGLEPDCADAP